MANLRLGETAAELPAFLIVTLFSICLPHSAASRHESQHVEMEIAFGNATGWPVAGSTRHS